MRKVWIAWRLRPRHVCRRGEVGSRRL